MNENLSSKVQNRRKDNSAIDKTGLPQTYNDTKVALLPRDPVWTYIYWEISKETINDFTSKYGNNFNPSSFVIRVYDITDINFNGNNANRYFDVNVDSSALSWYINVGEFNRAWCVDIGYILNDGTFVNIARSNSITMPKHGVSSITDEQWALLQMEFERILRLSGDGVGKSSKELIKLMRQRWQEFTSLPSSSSLGGASSSSFRKDISKNTKNSKKKDFWLKADTEIIVYGATEPDADLLVCGKKVPVSNDGSFTLRFYLPDGQQHYPVEAKSSCGQMSKKISFKVKKETK